MNFKLGNWFKDNYYRIVNSIAFYPAIIAVLFLGLSAVSIAFDFSEQGQAIKAKLDWLRLRDASTARSIISSIAAGILSLAVFSFSMVMIVLNQTASQMSNRILDKLIGSRFQQIVLGVYVGTIVYALSLLSTIRNVDSGIQIPALSTYLLIALTICDIFLFIYFLHYITQSVKYDVIIRRISRETLKAMEASCAIVQNTDDKISIDSRSSIVTTKAGVYEGFSKHALLKLCDSQDCILSIHHLPGTFLLEGVPIASIDREVPIEVKEDIQSQLYIHESESIDANFFYGFRQLSEVGIKALSPGINDPGTAIQVLRALFELYTYLTTHRVSSQFRNDENIIRVISVELTFDEVFETTLRPIWDYGKEDRMVRKELQRLLGQVMLLAPKPVVTGFLEEVNAFSNTDAA